MKTIKLTHKQAMDIVNCLDTLQAMSGGVDDEFTKHCDLAGKLSEQITEQLNKLGYVKLPYKNK